jgi:HAD superfamily hydrolase (TIGR01509 family)
MDDAAARSFSDMIKAVIFDVDGTLIDTVDLHAQAWVEALKHFGHEIAYQDLRSQIGKGGDQILHGLLPPDVIEERGDEIKDFRSDLFKRDYLHRARAFPGVRELFERIRASGQRAVLASSGNADEVEQYKEIAGIADLIDSATSSDDAERSKPFPDIFEAALAKLAPLGSDEAVVIGDTPYDAEAARKAQIKSIGVLSGGFAEQALTDAGCIAVYRDVEDLLHNYERSPLAS